MTDSNPPQSPVNTVLDLFVYAPVGLALTAAEEVPKLAAKGRSSLNQRLTIARMVGQFAVTQGRKEIERRFAPPAPRATPPSTPPSPSSTSELSYEELLATDGGASLGDEPAAPTSAAGATGPDSGPVIAESPGAATVNGAPRVGSLAIPGYDSLAASQVVQRLAGLSRDELDAVGAYEASHRNRRTILTRVRQLQAG